MIFVFLAIIMTDSSISSSEKDFYCDFTKTETPLCKKDNKFYSCKWA